MVPPTAVETVSRKAGSGSLAALVLWPLLLGACGPAAPPSEALPGSPEVEARRNLVLVSIDTLRADRLHLYGYERPTSPFLDALAGEAVVFDRFYSSGGGTLPAHMSMLTSLPPEVHGVYGKEDRLAAARTTLAERLAASGYRSAAFTDGGFTASAFGFGQGFEIYDDSGGGLQTTLPKALRWIDSADDRPFFLFLHSYDVHSKPTGRPYDCPGDFADLYTGDYAGTFAGCVGKRCASKLLGWLNKRLEGRQPFALADYLGPAEIELISSRYDGCINYVDAELAELAGQLRGRGLWDETLFVVTSDHGEEFLDHGRLLHVQGSYEELAHLPLVLKLPDSEMGGLRIPGLASMIDLAPTVLSGLGLETGRDMVGQDLLSVVRGDRAAPRKIHIQGTIRSERWKLLRTSDEILLFDLATDPGESRDLAALHPERVARLLARSERTRKRYLAHRRRLEAGDATEPESTGLSVEQIERLRALGYLD